MDASPVKQWRQDHDILQKDLAAEMGMSPSTLSQKENGHLDPIFFPYNIIMP